METLILPSLCSCSIPSSNSQIRNSRRLAGVSCTLKFSDPFGRKLKPDCKTRWKQNWRVTRMQVVEEDYELRQMKDMAAARKRWETLAWVKGSTSIPIFDVDSGFDIGTLSRKITNFLMGGWWSGVPTLSYNNLFLDKVEEKFPKDTDLIVACQKGLRSLAACELLYSAGYKNLFWVQGGLEAAEEEDLPREGPQSFKFAGIGGLSEFLGWTDQQRAAAAKEGWQYRLVFSARLVGVFLVADGLFLAAQHVGHYLQEIRSH
ncbi:Rhodanese-like domain-containing protein 11, chloroplastic [Ancistrocladus abbreviatus]